jgi:competence protein ComEA
MTLREKRGMIVLLIVVIFFQIYRFNYRPNKMAVELERFPIVEVRRVELEKPVYRPRPIVRIQINAADSIEWQKLRGIGPVLAGRIVRYRTALGGFHSVEQVGEVYGLRDSVFQSIRGQLTLMGEVSKIHINRAEWRELIKHPYIDRRQTDAIVKYRKAERWIYGEADLVVNLLFDSVVAQKILPYLDFSFP